MKHSRGSPATRAITVYSLSPRNQSSACIILAVTSLTQHFNRSLEILFELIRIESVNPTLVPGGAGEQAIAEYLSGFLTSQGIRSRLQPVDPGRFNVLAEVQGSSPGPRVLLNGHLDTVSIAGMKQPLAPVLEDGRVYGRGAQDMKGGLAAAVAALLALSRHREDWKGEVVLAAVADEEDLSLGTTCFLEQWPRDRPFDFALVLEPTDLQVATAHKGFAWVEVTTRGKAAHGSRPADGVDAIRLMGRFLDHLDRLDRDLQRRPLHGLLGSGSLHASVIQGGRQWSSYPDRCRLKYERRTVPPETRATVESEFRRILQACRRQDPHFRGEASLVCAREPFEADPDQAALQRFYRTARSQRPRHVRWGSVSFWTDAALLAAASIPTLVFGPRGAGLHSLEEYVVAEDLSACAEIIYRFVTQARAD